MEKKDQKENRETDVQGGDGDKIQHCPVGCWGNWGSSRAWIVTLWL